MEPKHVNDVVECLLHNGGSVKYQDLSDHFQKFLARGTYFNVLPNLADTLSTYPHLFHTTDEDSQKRVSLTVKVSLCHIHWSRTGCQDHGCPGIHLCRTMAQGQPCKFGDACKFGHNLITKPNFKVLDDCKLLGFPEPLILMMFRNMFPKFPLICKFYQTSSCEFGDSGVNAHGALCPALHVCLHYVKGDCVMGGPDKCPHSHNILSLQPKALLEQCAVSTDCSPNEVLAAAKQALEDSGVGRLDIAAQIRSPGGSTDSPSNGDGAAQGRSTPESSYGDGAAQGRSTPESSDGDGAAQGRSTPESSYGDELYICMDHLKERGGCLHKDECRNVHFEQSYLWQYSAGQEGGEEVGEYFCDESNKEIELHFIDVTKSECYSTLTNVDGGKPFMINFDDMMMVSYWGEETPIRRLSTPSSVSTSTNPYSTQWLWYSLDKHNNWQKYEKAGKFDMTVLEEAYLQGSQTYNFSTAHNTYVVSFRDMIQKNTCDGTERRLRRRPSLLNIQQRIDALAAASGKTSTTKSKKATVPDVPDRSAL